MTSSHHSGTFTPTAARKLKPLKQAHRNVSLQYSDNGVFSNLQQTCPTNKALAPGRCQASVFIAADVLLYRLETSERWRCSQDPSRQATHLIPHDNMVGLLDRVLLKRTCSNKGGLIPAPPHPSFTVSIGLGFFFFFDSSTLSYCV